jgi:hypothetical protein
MLVAVDEIGRAAHGLLEGVELGVDLGRDLGAVGRRPARHGLQHLAALAGARRARSRHRRQRRGAGEVEVHAEIGLAGEGRKFAREGRPVRAIGHRARGAEAAGRQQIENAATDAGRHGKSSAQRTNPNMALI